MPEETPKTLKIQLAHSRRMRAAGSDDLRIYQRGDIIECSREIALQWISSGLADGVTSDTKPSKGEAIIRGGKKPSSKAAKVSE